MKIYDRNAGRRIVHVRKGSKAYGPGAAGTKLDIMNKVEVTDVGAEGATVSQPGMLNEFWSLLGTYEGNTIVLQDGAFVEPVPAKVKKERVVKEKIVKEKIVKPAPVKDEVVAPVEPQMSNVEKALAYARAKRASG